MFFNPQLTQEYEFNPQTIKPDNLHPPTYKTRHFTPLPCSTLVLRSTGRLKGPCKEAGPFTHRPIVKALNDIINNIDINMDNRIVIEANSMAYEISKYKFHKPTTWQ